ncbi:MAG: DNA glycosylase [Methanomassiliicoccales archaeon]
MDLGIIDLEHTLSCGQAFRWWKRGESWEGVIGSSLVRLTQKGNEIEVESDLSDKELERYFRADDDYESIIKDISREPYVAALARRYRGLRLLRQDPWECSASYILATFSNIPRIKGMIEKVCTLYGKEIAPGIMSFPRPEDILRDEAAAERCGLGFRCHRFLQFARQVSQGEVDFDCLRGLSYESSHRALVALEGIGDKVADCIALFSLDHLEAFPIDVRISRVLKDRYGMCGSYARLSREARGRFGPYAGYAQEFIYYAEDKKNRQRSVLNPSGS